MESCIMFIDWNAVKMLIHVTLANGFKAIPMKSEKVFFFFFFWDWQASSKIYMEVQNT